MSRQMTRQLHMGCGESLSAALPAARQERQQPEQEKHRTDQSKLKDEQVQKEKGAC